MSSKAVLAIRAGGGNPNHHLWNNHGTWFVHYTLHEPLTKERRRESLGTKSVRAARRRRDALFAALPSPSAAVFSTVNN